MSLLLRLYPDPWRQRYGEEVQHDEYGAYRDGAAALPFFIAAMAALAARDQSFFAPRILE
jgi:hypothetical protein